MLDVEIAHGTARIDGVIYRREEIERLEKMAPSVVRILHQARKMFDGDWLPVKDADKYVSPETRRPPSKPGSPVEQLASFRALRQD